MKPQLQTTFGGEDAPDQEKGNCFATCVATVLGIDVAGVPNFCVKESWWTDTQGWLGERGLALISCEVRDWAPAAALSIASGPGPRGHRHCVVYDGNGLVHDPHPSGGGLLKVDAHEFFIVVDERALRSFLQEQPLRARIAELEARLADIREWAIVESDDGARTLLSRLDSCEAIATCPHGDVFHNHHDGCPSCVSAENKP